MRFIHTISLMVFLIFSHAMPVMGEEATTYLCIPDLSTGFKSEAPGKWVVSRFTVIGQRYLLSKKGDKWYWNEFGEPIHSPGNECGVFSKLGYLECPYFGTTFRFNKNSLRFIAVHLYGYVVADAEIEKESTLTPYIMIGKCSPL